MVAALPASAAGGCPNGTVAVRNQAVACFKQTVLATRKTLPPAQKRL